MQQGNALLRPKPRKCRLEFQRLIDGFLHERLDRVLAPWTERAAAEAARKPLTPAKPTPWTSVASPSSTVTPPSMRICGFPVACPLIVVVAKDRDHGNLDDGKLAHQDTRLIRQAVVGEVATEQQHIRRLVDLRKERLKSTLRVL
jgi:hypothetical protein